MQTHSSTQQEVIAPSPASPRAMVIQTGHENLLEGPWAQWALLTWNTSVWLGCGCECWSPLCWLWCWLCHWDQTSDGLPWNWPLLWPPSAGGGKKRQKSESSSFKTLTCFGGFIRWCPCLQMPLQKSALSATLPLLGGSQRQFQHWCKNQYNVKIKLM